MVNGIIKKPKKQAANRQPLFLLGDIEFELIESPKSFDFIERSVFSEHSKIEKKPGLQWTGEALHEISLGFRFGCQWCSPDEQLKRLQDARRKHQPMALVMGTGRIAGNYVIEEIRTNLIATDLKGNLDIIEVQVRLKETLTKPPKTKPFGQSPFKKRKGR